MQEIKCPNCGKVFQVDEAGYAQIVRQVRDRAFDAELTKRISELEEKKQNDLTLALMRQEKAQEQALVHKDQELAGKNLEIQELRAQLDRAGTERELAVSKAVQEKDRILSLFPDKEGPFQFGMA